MESQAKEAAEAAASERALLTSKAEETNRLLQNAQTELEDRQVALDTYKQQCVF